ncbi:SCO family protein [Paludisphaera mucosa]|uniref:SCO family protein n=1 Tax=Paludisphaera mucosa TaxID=3030827 RepID=A0ABT6FAF9_9BACT|nr:SCO family protein [Paludisphaera mucosa]MDG3004378.1 SCO family protein [Paludisphaera mucosa]
MLGLLFELAAARQRRPHPNDGRLRICDRFADVPVVNQFGSRFRFHRDFVGGRMLVVSTMYTECRGTCPTTTRTLQRLREELSPALGPALAFMSISLDPAVDRPDVLRSYAKRYGADAAAPGLCPWHFLTGEKSDLEKLRKSLGMYDLNPAVEADITRHESTLLFGNCDRDRWATLSAGLRLPLLIEALRRVVGTTPEQRFGFKI